MNKPLNEKSYFALAVLAFLYCFIGLYVLSADYFLGEGWQEQSGVTYSVSVMASIVPTIIPTAAITPVPGASEVILSIAWFMVIPAVMLMLYFADWFYVNDKGEKGSEVIAPIFAGILLLFMMFCFMQFIIPVPGYYARDMLVYIYLKDTDWFVIFYGLLLWGLSAALLFITIFKILIVMKIKGNNN